MHVMIDWLDIVLPCIHKRPIFGGTFSKADFDGKLEWSTMTRRNIEGSYSSNLAIISDGPERIRVSGNFVKFLQGHNLFGSSDISALVLGVMEVLLNEDIGLCPIAKDLEAWSFGNYEIKMLDVTGMYPMESREQVRSWVRTASVSAYLVHRGSGVMKGGTVYWGKNSRLWGLKGYCKGDEVDTHPPAYNLPYRDRVIAYADKMLRIELRLFGRALKPAGISKSHRWMVKGFPEQQFQEYVSKLKLNDQMPVSSTIIQNLPGSAAMAYNLWLRGDDIRQILTKRTLYSYRRLLLAHGIDLLMPPYSQNVERLQLSATLEEGPQAPPEWAIDTPIYFNPRFKSPA